MSVSRDDFSIAFRSALLQRGGAQKFSILSLIILAIFIFFLDVYGFTAVKKTRNIINDIIFRVSYIASSPSRFIPNTNKSISSHFFLKEENKKLKQVIENYKSLDLNLEYLTNENKNLRKALDAENIDNNQKHIVLAKVLVDRNSPFLKSIIINKGTRSGIKKGMPVTQDNYLVGRIVDTNYLSSRVLLINDLNSRIPVTLDSDSTQAILTGSGTANPKLEYLPEEYEIEDEVTIFASGKDGIFIPGTPIGKTTNSSGKNSNEVKLFVDPNQLSFVTVKLVRLNKEKF
ncbi:rod shape-determining protein MreC [Pelagibacteraceae bacterium]|nr:rod shape-determining protein MreC [Pelagibacteraceae bacterium]MDC0952756.1 rod shape-determining protein MreC [Pelagibacteraceae bacterium]